MSYTELHIGKLIKVDLAGQTLEERLHIINDHQPFDDYYDDIVEYFKSGENDEYLIVGEDLYQVKSLYGGESDSFVSHRTKNEDGSIDYVLEFYNGGTCFSEMAEKLIDKLNK